MQLSLGYYNYYAIIPLKYVVLINNCHVKKLVSYIIVTNELKMGIPYSNLYTSYIHM